MTTHSEAARKGWETRRANAAKREADAVAAFAAALTLALAKREAERLRVAALHAAEAAAHWAKMPAATRETALERGWGAHLPADVLAEITG